MPRRRTPADRAREQADRDALTAVLVAAQRAECARRGVPVPTKPSNDPETVARLRDVLVSIASSNARSKAFARDLRTLLRSAQSTEPKE